MPLTHPAALLCIMLVSLMTSKLENFEKEIDGMTLSVTLDRDFYHLARISISCPQRGPARKPFKDDFTVELTYDDDTDVLLEGYIGTRYAMTEYKNILQSGGISIFWNKYVSLLEAIQACGLPAQMGDLNMFVDLDAVENEELDCPKQEKALATRVAGKKTLTRAFDELQARRCPPVTLEDNYTVKRAFVGAVRQNGAEFQSPQYLPGKVLDIWTAQRCIMPLRSYDKHVKGPDGKTHCGYQFDSHPREFGPSDPRKEASAQFNEYLDKHLDKTLRSMYPRYFEQIKRRRERADAKARRIAILRRHLEEDESSVSPDRTEHMASCFARPNPDKPKLSTRVQHTHPFAYVNSISRDISLTYPWKRIDEETKLRVRLKDSSRSW
ncbi:hypothetical protein FOL47_004845 [Perkinsus chesapeaki]|uniref:Uncharacterized protein n=1 Tax=Perkinsus chesapeaki TaxID=330153 RepID=A0A7J6M0B8_PERCH|nr:hypothetical protein FOL47_004845 [Perkinsus chesapeaki]